MLLFASMVLLLCASNLNLCRQNPHVFDESSIAHLFQHYILCETNSPTKTKHAVISLNEIIPTPQLEDLRMASLTALARACFSARVQRYNSSAIGYASRTGGKRPIDQRPLDQRCLIFLSLMSKVALLNGRIARSSRLCMSASHQAASSWARSSVPIGTCEIYEAPWSRLILMFRRLGSTSAIWGMIIFQVSTNATCEKLMSRCMLRTARW